MNPRFTVLGGSTPFTAVLVDALAARAADLDRHEIVLHGRDARNLEWVRRHAAGRLEPLGWTVRSERDMARALDGAAVVLHQIRYGDLTLRAAAEDLCRRFGVVADETLGAAALTVALETRGPLDRVCATLRRACPAATVLNLTNPLSLTTAWMHAHGLDVVGLCELPSETARMVAERLGLALERLSWSYAGLNHRGFLYRIHDGAEDLIPRLVETLGGGVLNGIEGPSIRRLQAVPLKYFRTITEPQPAAESRARALMRLRARALIELERDSDTTPPSLAGRMTDWYRSAVVPLLVARSARSGNGRVATTVNLHDGDLVRERRVSVSRAGIEALEEPPPPDRVAAWIERFERHERLCLAALDTPRVATLAAALAHDPASPRAESERLARAIFEHSTDLARNRSCVSQS